MSRICMAEVVFQPFPDKCPIPPNVVGIIGGHSGRDPTFILLFNGKEIVIEAPTDPPGIPSVDSYDPEHPMYDRILGERYDKVFAHYLQIIQSLIATIQWGKTNWAYLLPPMKNTGYQILQKPKRIQQITCPPWGRLIPISEVEFTVFTWMGSDRRGIWRGKKCDIFVGWCDTELKAVNRAMYAWRLLEGMDLTFEFYGHLIDEDGNIIGTVSEAGWGRPVTLADRPKVYAAVAKLQRHGILYRGCITNRFIITNGKVRLTEIDAAHSLATGMWDFTRMEDLPRLVELWHWSELGQLFWELEHEGPYGCWRLPCRRFITAYNHQYIPLPPSPELPLGGIMLWPKFFEDHKVPVWPEYRNQRKDSAARTRRRLLTAKNIDDDADDSVLSIDSRDYEDRRPMLAPVLRAKHQRRVHHPYFSRLRTRESRVITFSDSSSITEVSSSESDRETLF